MCFRYTSTSHWSSDNNENCILSTVEMNRIGSMQRKIIASDKDWDLYNYDQTIQSCRDSFPSGTSTKGNSNNRALQHKYN